MKQMMRWGRSTLAVVAVLALAGLAVRAYPVAAEKARVLPAPVVDVSPG